MNKLLLVALLGCTLVAITAAESLENSESDLQFAQAEPHAREVREAKNDRKLSKKEKKENNLGGKGKNSSKKGKKAKKSAKKGKKSKKSSRRGKKLGTRRQQKSAKKDKQSKKEERTEKKEQKKAEKKQKRKNKKAQRKSVKQNIRQTACNADEECLTLAVKYLKQVKDKVKNFNVQKARIEKFKKLSVSKAGKKSEFKNDLSRLREAGGGNSSALKCQGKGDGAGQAAMKDAVDKLTACETQIKEKCDKAAPAYNQTEADDCAKKMTTLSTAVEACTKVTDATKVCACWKADALKTASAAISTCNLATVNSAFVKFKTSCTNSFSTCRQTQDSASSVIYTCSAANSADKLISKLKDVTENKASLEKLTATAKSKASGSRVKRAVTCGMFITTCKRIASMAKNAIFSPKIKEMADEANADPPATCTAAEKAMLTSDVVSELDKASTAADEAIAAVQKDLEVQTGSTASSAIIAAVTTASASTTKAPTGRRILRDMFHM